MPNINSLTYNGMKSTDLGVYVTGSGSFDAAEMDADKYEIAGRNGDLIIPKNRYKNIVVTYPAFIPKAFQEKAQSIRNWMRSAKAYARLEDTYDMEHYRLGLASGIQSFEPVNRNDASNFQLSFDCKPQRFLKTGETPLPIEPEAHSYSGEIVEFETVAVDDMTKAEVSLSPIQSGSGDPSPTNVRPITGHTGATLKIGAEYPTADREYTSSFGQTVYGGTFDWVSGKLVVEWASVTYDGTESWSLSAYSGKTVFYIAKHDFVKTISTYAGKIICDKLQTASGNYTLAQTSFAISGYSDTVQYPGQNWIYIRLDDSITTSQECSAWLAENPIQVVYKLATPIEIDLDQTEVQTLLGLNNVWASDGTVEINYADPFNVDNPTYFEARPLFEITNPAQNDVLNVNGKTITFLSSYTGTVTIDCETMDCFSGYTNLNYLISATDFLVLNEGVNIVTWSGSGTCTMTPRWWEL